MNHRRVAIAESLEAALPGVAFASPSSGTWQLVTQSADWRLEPDGRGYWLVLTKVRANGSSKQPLEIQQRAGAWPYPMKAARQVAGGPVGWQAEVYLDGTSSDIDRIARAVALVTEVHSRRLDHSASNDDSPPDGMGDWQTVARQALSNADVSPDGSGLRVALPQCSHPIHIGPARTGLRSRLVIARGIDGRLTMKGTAPVLADYLLVTNGQLRGTRLALRRDGESDSVVLETAVAWKDLTASALRTALARLEATAANVLPVIRWLRETPGADAVYSDYLLTGQTETAAHC